MTVRGVVAALHGHAGKLSRLSVRGVKRGTEDNASAEDVDTLLRTFLRDGGASLGVSPCLAVCCALDEEDEPCDGCAACRATR